MKHDALPSSPTRKVRNSKRPPLIPVTDIAKVKKVVSYAESSDEDEPFQFGGASTQRRRRARVVPVVKDEDDYEVFDKIKLPFCNICEANRSRRHKSGRIIKN